MCGAAGCPDAHSQDAAGGAAETIVGGFAVDKEARAARPLVGDHGSIAAAFFTHHEEQANPALARRPQPFRRRDLGGENPLRITRTASD